MEYIIIIIGLALSILGIVGSVLPALPGPPFSYFAILLLHFGSDKIQLSKTSLIIFGILTASTLIIDFILPIFGAKVYGISKTGTWGSILGLLLGLVFFPPFGFIVGIFLGAVIGELWAGKKESEALKAGTISFLGSLMSIVFKLILAGSMFLWFVKELFDLF